MYKLLCNRHIKNGEQTINHQNKEVWKHQCRHLKKKITLQIELSCMSNQLPVHDPHLSCIFLNHDDKYYEGGASLCLHLSKRSVKHIN